MVKFDSRLQFFRWRSTKAHSARGAEGGEEHETNVALRRQKAPPRGAGSGIFAERGPQRCDCSLRHSSRPSACPCWLSGERRGRTRRRSGRRCFEDLGQDVEYVMLMVEAHGLLMLGKLACTVEQRARFRVLSTQTTAKETSTSCAPGKRKRKKRRRSFLELPLLHALLALGNLVFSQRVPCA